MCLHFLPVAVIKSFDKGSVGVRVFILAHSSRAQSVMAGRSQQQEPEGANWSHDVLSERRAVEACVPVPRQPFPFHQSGNQPMETVATTFKMGLLPLLGRLKASPTDTPTGRPHLQFLMETPFPG